VGKERKGGMCGKAAKGALTEGAGVPCKEKGAEKRKKAKENRGRRSDARGQAMRSTARVEERLSRRVKEKSGGALWKERPRRGTIVGSRMVYKRGSSFIPSLQEMQKPGVLCGR